MIASSTLLLVFDVIKNRKPAYLANKLEIIREAGMAVRGPTVKDDYYPDISSTGFIEERSSLIGFPES